MDRFEAAKWMVEHPGQRMVDSDGDEWWFDKRSAAFRAIMLGGEFPACLFGDTILTFDIKAQTRPPVKPHRRKTKPWVDIDGNCNVRIPKRFRGQKIELEVKVCDE